MQLLKELMTGIARLSDDGQSSQEASPVARETYDQPLDQYDRPTESNVMSQQSQVDDLQLNEPEDPNRQGLIRNVEGAHLVYKRQQPSGTFDELWIFGTDNLQQMGRIKQHILAGTDIEEGLTASADGSQQYEQWSAGNATLIFVTGLPN